MTSEALRLGAGIAIGFVLYDLIRYGLDEVNLIRAFVVGVLSTLAWLFVKRSKGTRRTLTKRESK